MAKYGLVLILNPVLSTYSSSEHGIVDKSFLGQVMEINGHAEFYWRTLLLDSFRLIVFPIGLLNF